MYDILGALLPTINTNRVTLTTSPSGDINLSVNLYSEDKTFDDIDPAVTGRVVSTTGEIVEPGDSFGIADTIKVAIIVSTSLEAKLAADQIIRSGIQISGPAFGDLIESNSVYFTTAPAKRSSRLNFISNDITILQTPEASSDAVLDSDNDLGARYPIRFTIEGLPKDLNYLHIQSFCYIDKNRLFDIFPELGLIGNPVASDSITETGAYLVSSIRGPGIEDLIISDGRLNPTSFVLVRENGGQYTGPYHYHPPTETYMEGSFHQQTPHRNLKKVAVRNDKVQDFRTFSRNQPNPYDFNNLNSLLNNFSAIANESVKAMKEKIKLRNRTSDSYELNNTSIETQLFSDNVVSGQIKIDQVEIMRERSAFGFLFDALLPRQKLYSLWWRDMFRLVDAKIIRRRLTNEYIGHDKNGFPDRKVFDSNEIEEVIVSAGETNSTVIDQIRTTPRLDAERQQRLSSTDYYDPSSLLDSTRLSTELDSHRREVENRLYVANKVFGESKKDLTIATADYKRARVDLDNVRKVGSAIGLRKAKSLFRDAESAAQQAASDNSLAELELSSAQSAVDALPVSEPVKATLRDHNWITRGLPLQGAIQSSQTYGTNPDDPSEVLFPWVRNLVMEDYTFEQNKNLTGVYQYGVELTYEDGLVKYIFEVIDNLKKNQTFLKELSSETKNTSNYDRPGRFNDQFLEYLRNNTVTRLFMISAYADAMMLFTSYTMSQDEETITRYANAYAGDEFSGSVFERGVLQFMFEFVGTGDRESLPGLLLDRLVQGIFNSENGAFSPENLENFYLFESHYDLLIKSLTEMLDLASNVDAAGQTFDKSHVSGRTPSLIKAKKFFKEVTGGQFISDPRMGQFLTQMDTEGVVDLRVPTKARAAILPGRVNPFLESYESETLAELQENEIRRFESSNVSEEDLETLNESIAYFAPFEFFGSMMYSFGSTTSAPTGGNSLATEQMFLLDAVISNNSFSRAGYGEMHSYTRERTQGALQQIQAEQPAQSGVVTRSFNIISQDGDDPRDISPAALSECESLSRSSIDALISSQRMQESTQRSERAMELLRNRTNSIMNMIGQAQPQIRDVSRETSESTTFPALTRESSILRMFDKASIINGPLPEVEKLPWQIAGAIKKPQVLGVTKEGLLSRSLYGNMMSVQKQVGFEKDAFGTPKLDKPILKPVTVGEMRAGLKPGTYKTLPFESPALGITQDKNVSLIDSTFVVKSKATVEAAPSAALATTTANSTTATSATVQSTQTTAATRFRASRVGSFSGVTANRFY